jgi:ribokinase
MNADYTVVAERIPEPGETVIGGPMTVLPGGKSSNQAVACAKMGVPTSIVGVLGNDENATFLEQHLQKSGVGTDYIGHADVHTGSTIITVDSHGENTIVVSPGANGLLDVKSVRERADELHEASVVGLCLETPLETVVEAARIVSESDGETVVNLSPFQPEAAQALAAYANVLIVNEHECAGLVGQVAKNIVTASLITVDSDWNGIASALQELGFSNTCVTLGGDGCVVISHDGTTDAASIVRITPPAAKIVDTTGCGDSFMGGVIAGRTLGMDLVASACMGNIFASFAAQAPGAQSSYGDLNAVFDLYLQQKHIE